MYILTAEEPGDYDDYYQRPLHVLKASEDKKKLEAYWEGLRIQPRVNGGRDITTCRKWNGLTLIEHYIEEVEVL